MSFDRWRCLGSADTIHPTASAEPKAGHPLDDQPQGSGQGRQTAAHSGGNDHDHALLRLLRQALRPYVRPRPSPLLLLPGLPAPDGGPPARLERADRQHHGHPTDRRAARGGARRPIPCRPHPRHGGRTADRSLLEMKRRVAGSAAKRAVRPRKTPASQGSRQAGKWNWPLAAGRSRPHLVAVTLAPLGAGVKPVGCTHLATAT